MKKLLAILTLCLVCAFCAVGFTACENGGNTADTRNTQILSIYNTYVAYAEENGETPLSYNEWLKSIKGENGLDGQDGKDGVSIISIEKVSTDGLIDTYIITYSDETTTTFTVSNGAQGEKGDKGNEGAKGDTGENGKSVYEIWLDMGFDGTEMDFMEWIKGDSAYEIWLEMGFDGTDIDFLMWLKGEQGETGEQGERGEQGVKGDKGDTGEKGDKGDKGDKGEKGDKGDTGDKGDKGEKGDTGATGANGKSAYELYKEKYGYEKSEEEWLYDLVNGKLALKETFTVSFETDGGTEVEPQQITSGKKAIKPADPEKSGCVFKGWFVGDEQWNFLYCIVTENTVLTAKWIEIEYDTNVGDKDDIEVNLQDEEITLTATHKAGYTWLGWYDGDEKVSKGNSYNFTFNQKDADKVYTAKFSKVTLRKNVDGAGTIPALNGKYFLGDHITATATVNDGYVFKGWYSGGEKVSDDGELSYDIIFGAANQTYTATYIANPVTVAKNLSAAGTVTKQSTGVTGGDYTVTATTNSGYTWLGWYDGNNKVSVGTSLTYTFILTETPVTLTAKWTEYSVTLNKNYDKAGTLTGSGRTAAGSSATVKAATDYTDYFTFDGWYNGTAKVSSSLNYTFDMPSSNITLTAKWNLKSGVETITTASQLNAIDGTKTYILLNDINLSGITFTSKEISASGILDGLGCKIKNVDCNLISQNNGKIQNLVIETVTASVAITAPFVIKNNNLIQNCGVIHNSNYTGYTMSVYGFAQYNYGQILNCYAKGNAGMAQCGFVDMNAGTIKNCYSELDVVGNFYYPGSTMLGGVVNQNSGTIESCYYSGNMSVKNESSIGKAFAYAFRNCGKGTISNCFSVGTLYAHSGWTVFYNDYNYNNENGTITNCYQTISKSASTLDCGKVSDISNFYNKNFVTGTIGFKEYGKGTVASGYVWIFESGKLPKLFWE